MGPLEIVMRNIAQLRPRAGNPRTHTRRQKEQLARAIKRFSFTVPVVVDEDSVILAGHARVEAAQMLGMWPGRQGLPLLRLSAASAGPESAR